MLKFLGLGQWESFQIVFCILLTYHLYHFIDFYILERIAKILQNQSYFTPAFCISATAPNQLLSRIPYFISVEMY